MQQNFARSKSDDTPMSVECRTFDVALKVSEYPRCASGPVSVSRIGQEIAA